MSKTSSPNMEGNLTNQRPLTERKSLITNSCNEARDKPCLDRHVVTNPNCTHACFDELKCGFLYEIDHKYLPPKCPIQLKSIRVAMIAEKNEYSVTVRFPSTQALDIYFSSQTEMGGGQPARRYPDLDEQFTMGVKLGKQVLIRQIFPPEFNEQGKLRCFWLVSITITPKINQLDPLDESAYKDVEVQVHEHNSAYKPDGFLTWGVRRKITFMGRCKERMAISSVPSVSSLLKDEEDDVEKSSDDETRDVSLKRRRRSLRDAKIKKTFKSKLVKYEEKKAVSKIVKRQKVKLSYGRWSKERYKNAEVKMLEIMKEKGAVHEKPMLRPALRLEARKHIGDTGLLDHLLKHMAGKVAPNGEDRFRRRHNADGAMEYWLESAELVDLRKEAGVNDPYWFPPPGWKPGDSLTEEPTSGKDIKMLQEEISIIRRDVQELITWKRSEENGDKAIVPFSKSTSENSFLDNRVGLVSTMKEYENLLKRKTELEHELSQVSGTLEKLEVLQEGSRKERGNSDVGEEREASVSLAMQESEKMVINGGDREEEESRAASKAAMKERLRSGFRICKPQGTFLWPNMAAAATGCSTGTSAGNNNSTTGSNVLSPHQVLVQQVDSCSPFPTSMVPTPPSVSSATTSPPPLLLLFPPTQAAGSGYSKRLF